MNKLDRIRAKTIDFIIKSPKKTLLLFCLLNLFILPGLGFLKTDFSYKSWYNDNDTQVKRFQEFEKNFGNDDNLVLIVKDEQGVLNKKTLAAISELTEILWNTKEIIRVDSLTNFQYTSAKDDELEVADLVPKKMLATFSQNDVQSIKAKIHKEPMLENYLISTDMKSSILLAYVRPALTSIPDHSAITQDIRQKLEEFKSDYPNLQIHLSGGVTLVDDFKMATFNDMAILIPVLYIVFSLLLYWRYRSISTIALIFTTISSSTLLMMGLAGYSGLTINTLTAACPTILMTIALSDAVHIFSSYFLALKHDYSHTSSIEYSLRKNFYPTLLTSLTTGVGFLSFYDALVQPVADLGIMVFFGVIYAWIVTYFFLGPFILIKETLFKKFIKGSIKSANIEQEMTLTPLSKRFVDIIHRHSKLILALTFFLIMISSVYISKLTVNMDPMEQFSKEHPTVISNNFLAQNFNYNSMVELVIDSGTEGGAKSVEFLNRINQFIIELEKDPSISKTTSIVQILKSVNRSMFGGAEEYYQLPATKNAVAESLLLYSMGLPPGKEIDNLINLNHQKVRISVQWKLRDSLHSLNKIDDIVKLAKKMKLDLTVTGKTPLFHQLTPYIVKTFFDSFFMAFIGITIILILSLKSVFLGLLALIPNLFPLLLGGFFFYFTGFDIDMGTVIVASVCLGIAVDDSIHFLFEYKKYQDNGSTAAQAIGMIFTGTFPALFMTTLLISVGFSTFVLGDYIPNVKFGLSVAAILLIALIADFIILPAILLTLGHKKAS